jgi:hypothetical protein
MLNLVAAITAKIRRPSDSGEAWSLWRCACRACLSVHLKLGSRLSFTDDAKRFGAAQVGRVFVLRSLCFD